jgi:4-hydroxy-4-methyl-2-oxoglutarate aldolase
MPLETEPLPKRVLDELRSLDTCTVSNAIETLNVRLRNEGFVTGAVHCQFPQFPPMLGYAVTGRIQTSSPPIAARCYHDRLDFWEHVLTIPSPRVLVMQDLDRTPGVGALVGGVHAAVALALNCVGYVSNGAVRDLDAVEAAGFHLFAGGVTVSHAYAHIVDFGEPVEIGGLKIEPGDLIHGDRHGVHTIPLSVAAAISRRSAEMTARERELIAYCRSAGFGLHELDEKFRLMR